MTINTIIDARRVGVTGVIMASDTAPEIPGYSLEIPGYSLGIPGPKQLLSLTDTDGKMVLICPSQITQVRRVFRDEEDVKYGIAKEVGEITILNLNSGYSEVTETVEVIADMLAKAGAIIRMGDKE